MLQIVGIALLVAFLILILREQKPIFALLLTVVAGISLFILLFEQIEAIIQMMRTLAKRAEIQPAFLETMLKIVGIAYVIEFAAQTLRDANLDSIAAKVELAGKIFILMQAIPILTLILDTVLKLLDS